MVRNFSLNYPSDLLDKVTLPKDSGQGRAAFDVWVDYMVNLKWAMWENKGPRKSDLLAPAHGPATATAAAAAPTPTTVTAAPADAATATAAGSVSVLSDPDPGVCMLFQ